MNPNKIKKYYIKAIKNSSRAIPELKKALKDNFIDGSAMVYFNKFNNY